MPTTKPPTSGATTLSAPTQEQRPPVGSWSGRLRALFVVPMLALAVLAGPAFIPSDAPVPQPFKASQAHAAPSHCVQVARHTFAVTRGNFPAALRALRATRGCGNTLADSICSASRQWWGGPARATVRFITYGQTDRC